MNQPAPDNTSPLSPPGKLIATAEIVTLADFAAKRAEKLGSVTAGLEAGIAKRGEEAAACAAAASFPPEDQCIAATKLTAKARAEVVGNSEDARWGFIEKVNAVAESVALTAALFASQQAALSRAGLGTPELN